MEEGEGGEEVVDVEGGEVVDFDEDSLGSRKLVGKMRGGVGMVETSNDLEVGVDRRLIFVVVYDFDVGVVVVNDDDGVKKIVVVLRFEKKVVVVEVVGVVLDDVMDEGVDGGVG